MYAKHNIRGELQLTVYYCATEKQTELDLSVQNSSEIISPMYGNGEAVVVIMLHQNHMHHIGKSNFSKELVKKNRSTTIALFHKNVHRPTAKKKSREKVYQKRAST
jgi:hypothetical protein